VRVRHEGHNIGLLPGRHVDKHLFVTGKGLTVQERQAVQKAALRLAAGAVAVGAAAAAPGMA
jgi:hypothetical protein